VKEHQVCARLLVIGGESEEADPQVTPEIGRLQALADEEGVLEKVTFLGRRGREALKHYYSAADIFVSTPWYEPFGITPVEAMACGTPVIGANVGGIKYTVVHGETGYLVPPRNPNALAKRMARLLKSPELLERFGQQAVQRANELFTWEKVAGQIATLYERVLVSVHPATRVEADPLDLIQTGFIEAQDTLRKAQEVLTAPILAAAQAITACLEKGGRVFVCGNGGSAADAQHFAAEFVGRFKFNGRKALPVLALNTDTAFVTAWSNDISYETIYSRQLEAFGQPGDLLVGISTSGRSQNIIEAFKTARQADIGCIAVLGGDGGHLLSLADIAIVVPALDTARIQEVQILALHLICELVEGHYISSQFMVSNSLLAPATSSVSSLWDLQPAETIPYTLEDGLTIRATRPGMDEIDGSEERLPDRRAGWQGRVAPTSKSTENKQEERKIRKWKN
jgi:phosphoheptose isomerase